MTLYDLYIMRNSFTLIYWSIFHLITRRLLCFVIIQSQISYAILSTALEADIIYDGIGHQLDITFNTEDRTEANNRVHKLQDNKLYKPFCCWRKYI